MPMQLTPSTEYFREYTSLDLLRQQQRQQAFERFTQREPFWFELVGELSSTAISDSQSSAQGARQRDDQREG